MGVVERALAGGPGKSITDLRRAAGADPNDTRSLLRLAELEAKAGHPAIACETYSRAGDVFVIQGFARRALSSFSQALTIARDEALVDRVQPIARAMGKLYAGERLIRDAVTTLDSAARWLIERGFDISALPLLELRIDIEDSDVARVRLAETFFRLGEPSKAADQLVTVFRRLHGQNRRDEALDVAERLLGKRRDVAIARASAEMYLARRRQGDPFLALAKLRICCDADPTHVPTLELLAMAFDLAGHGDKATRVRREIGFLAHKAGDGARADAAFQQVPAGRRVNVVEDSVAMIAVEIDEAWDELLIDSEKPDSAQPVAAAAVEKRIDPSRASFWPVEEGPSADESGSVVSVSLADVELIDGDPPASGERPASLLETALEGIESLIAQGRYDEASVLVVRYLTTRPRNRLLLERKAEIEEMQGAHLAGPPPALFGFVPRPRVRKPDSERSIPTGKREVRVS
jgi:tetratricopeptide (TPR) repeat protein